jgi:hypothetical protein
MTLVLRSCPPAPGSSLALQLRYAMALATVLGRTLILPPLWCGLDRYWAPHSGTIPGAQTTLPFQCPADHVLRLEGKYRSATVVSKHAPTSHTVNRQYMSTCMGPGHLTQGQ